MHPFVDQIKEAAEAVGRARSRRGYLEALTHFERKLACAPDFPSGYLNDADGEALTALGERVIASIEDRLDHRTDRPSVQRTLVAAVYTLRRDLEAIDTVVRHNAFIGTARRLG